MLKLTKKADYGLIALKHLASNGRHATASAKAIADCYGIPLPLLAKVLHRLTQSGFLQSLPGTNGGYRLARDPRKISALEVIRSIDGPFFLTSCFTARGECHQSPTCTVREPLRRVHESIVEALGNLMISEIAETDAAGALGVLEGS